MAAVNVVAHTSVAGAVAAVRGMAAAAAASTSAEGAISTIAPAAVAAAAAAGMPRGRPAPDMALKCALDLGVGTVRGCVKVDDTIPGILEGMNAGMWTVGVSVSGNEVGLSRQEWEALPKDQQKQRRAAAIRRLAEAGADYVIDSVADLPAVIEKINRRLAADGRP